MTTMTDAFHTEATNGTGRFRPLRIMGTAGEDRLFGGFGADLIAGRGGNDYIQDTVGENNLYGNEGDDELIGHGTFTGGPGNDLIRGDGLFRFYLGDGHDTIGSRGTEEYLTETGSYFKDHSLNDSVLRFGRGISPASVKLERHGGNLRFKLDDDDSVTIEHWFSDRNCRLRHVDFADGQRWDRATIAAMPVQIIGTSGHDTLEGTTKDDVIVGQEGNDFIFDPVGDNLIFGGAGNDIIMARGAIHGGAGDDTVIARGDPGGNVYYYQPGDGHDTLHINAGRDASSRSGTVAFLDPLQPENLWFRRQNDNLAITVVGSSAGLSISGWFLGTGYQVENFTLGNQKTMSADRVDALVQAMAQFDAPLTAHGSVSASMQQALAPVLAASWDHIGAS